VQSKALAKKQKTFSRAQHTHRHGKQQAGMSEEKAAGLEWCPCMREQEQKKTDSLSTKHSNNKERAPTGPCSTLMEVVDAV